MDLHQTARCLLVRLVVVGVAKERVPADEYAWRRWTRGLKTAALRVGMVWDRDSAVLGRVIGSYMTETVLPPAVMDGQMGAATLRRDSEPALPTVGPLPAHCSFPPIQPYRCIVRLMDCSFIHRVSSSRPHAETAACTRRMPNPLAALRHHARRSGR
jgi:hypothetical protein